MRGKSSSRVEGMEVVERSSKSKEEPQLSGAYIRSLVKHLSSSRPKDQTMNHPKSPNSTLEDHLDEPQSLEPPPPPPPPQHKKQVRRRLHTSRPYQERLLNMAEARREIVTALKFHRASMKQASEQHHNHRQAPQPLEGSRGCPNPNPNIYQPNQPAYFDPTLPPFPHPYPTLTPPPNIFDNLNFPLPNQPLGLNLNFQGFNNIDTPLYYSDTIKDPLVQPFSPHSYSSSSYSSSLPPSMEVTGGTHDATVDLGETKLLHIAMDEKEMAEIRSIGEKHDIEWNDTVNLMTSAWWSKFLETVEVDPMEGNGFHVFDEATDIPPWQKDGAGGDATASRYLMQHQDDYYLQEDTLPW